MKPLLSFHQWRMTVCLITLGLMGVLNVVGEIDDPSAKAVIARYDYSSPHVSLQSLQRALRDRDNMGIYIHWWYTMPSDCPMRKAHHSLTEMVRKCEEMFQKDPDMKKTGVRMAEQLDLCDIKQGGDDNQGGLAKPSPARLTITNMEYVRDVATRTNKNGVVTSTMLVRWRSVGRYAFVRARQLPAQKHWWVAILGGEERIHPFPEAKLEQELEAHKGN
jgi:hypothetical protein